MILHFNKEDMTMAHFMSFSVTRQCLLKVGALLMAVAIMAMGVSFAQAQ